MPMSADNPFNSLVSPDNKNMSSDNPYNSLLQQQQQSGMPVMNNSVNTQGSSVGSDIMSMVDGFNRQFEKAAIGTMQLGSYLIPGTQGFRDRLSQVNQEGSANGFVVGEKNANQSFNKNPMSYSAGALGGLIGSGIAYGGPSVAVGKAVAPEAAAAIQGLQGSSPYLGAAASGAAGGAAYGLTQPNNTFAGHLAAGAEGGVIGGLLGTVTKAAEQILAGGKTSSAVQRVISPEQAAIKDRAYQVATELGSDTAGFSGSDISKLDSLAKDFNKLGVQATPGQITKSPEILGSEMSSVLDKEGKRQVNWFQTPEINKTQESIKKTINSMSDDATDKIAKNLYGQLSDKTLSGEIADDVLKDPNIAERLKMINNSNLPEAALPDNNVIKLDLIKQDLDKQIRWDESLNEVGQKSFNISRNKILQAVDSQYADIYPAARAAAQKGIIKEQYLTKLNSVKSEIGQGVDPETGAVQSLKSINNMLFGTPRKVDNFLEDVATVGGDVDKAKSIINVTNNLAKNELTKLLSKSTNSLGDAISTGGASGVVKEFVTNIVNGRYNDALLKLTLSGQDKWMPLIQKELSKKGGDKSLGFMKIINEVSGTTQGATAGQVPGLFPGTTGVLSGQESQ